MFAFPSGMPVVFGIVSAVFGGLPVVLSSVSSATPVVFSVVPAVFFGVALAISIGTPVVLSGVLCEFWMVRIPESDRIFDEIGDDSMLLEPGNSENK